MIELTLQEAMYVYWKIKSYVWNSMPWSITWVDRVYFGDASGYSNNLPEPIQQDPEIIKKETDLVCHISTVAGGITYTPDDYYTPYALFSYTGNFYFDPSSGNYYFHPSLGITQTVLDYVGTVGTSENIQINSGWVQPDPDYNNWVYSMGQIGTLSIAFSFGTKTCPIYGGIYSVNGGGGDVFGTASCSITENASWPYNP